MFIYLVTFVLSIICYKLGIQEKNKYICFFFLTLAALCPAALAGLRDYSVSADFGAYGILAWDSALESRNFHSYISDSHNSVMSLEIFYLFFNFLISRFFNDFHMFFFFHQLLLVGIVTFVAYKCKNLNNSEFILIFYFFSFFNESFSWLRQAFALIFCLTFFYYLVEKNYKVSLLGGALSYLSHNSALFSFFLYILNEVARKHNRNYFTFVLLLVIVFVICFFYFNTILNYLISSGLYSDHYSMYVGQKGFKTHKIEILFLASILFSLFYFIKESNRNRYFFSFAVFNVLISILFNLFGGLIEIAVRIALYYEITLPILLLQCSKSQEENCKLLTISFVSLFFRWMYLSCTSDYGNTIPYSSELLGI